MILKNSIKNLVGLEKLFQRAPETIIGEFISRIEK